MVMCNKMSSAAKYCEKKILNKKPGIKKFLKRSQVNNKIYCIKKEELSLKEDFLKLKGFRIEVSQNSYILFENEEEYLKLLKIESNIKDSIKDIFNGKCKKERIYSHLDSIKKNIKKSTIEEIIIFYNPYKNMNPFRIEFPFICYYDDEEKEDNLLHEIRKNKDKKLEVKNQKLKDLISNSIIINYFRKNRARDLFRIMEKIDNKSDIVYTTFLIDKYADKNEMDIYSEMEEEEVKKNEWKKAMALNDDDDDDDDVDDDDDDVDDDDDDDYDVDDDDDDDDDDVDGDDVDDDDDDDDDEEPKKISIW